MVLFDYLIKLLVHNSDTIFIGLLVVLVGYNGWQLYYMKKEQQNKQEEKQKGRNCDNRNILKEIEEKLREQDRIFFDIKEQLKNNQNRLEKMKSEFERLEDKLSLLENNLYNRFNEKTADIKETLKILLSCYRGEEERIEEDSLE